MRTAWFGVYHSLGEWMTGTHAETAHPRRMASPGNGQPSPGAAPGTPAEQAQRQERQPSRRLAE
jgi:hypothetical protein